MSPVGLGALLAALPRNTDPNLLVGFETSDDAAVYRIDAANALVLTADFITPPVDDPHLFGRIAAANALSDVYAMGGRPIVCLNLVGFPSKQLGPEVLGKVIAGALSAITEAGAVLAGGHTVEDEEPKFGLSVTGLVHPDRVWRNVGARPGDVLVLTKPIGSGVLLNANRKGWVPAEALRSCLDSMATLNRAAAEALAGLEVHAATDVTGFGLAGHALEMARGSDVVARIELDAVPVFAAAEAMYARGVTTGANLANREMAGPHLRFARAVGRAREELVFDPQTNGGLLVALPPADVAAALAALARAGVATAARIGTIETRSAEYNLIFA